MPLTYIFCFLSAYYGPNAETLGNVKAEVWHYLAVQDVGAYLKNVLIFFVVDFMSFVINGILLWTTCKINVLEVLKNIQKTFWLIWATQEAALYIEVKIKQNFEIVWFLVPSCTLAVYRHLSLITVFYSTVSHSTNF